MHYRQVTVAMQGDGGRIKAAGKMSHEAFLNWVRTKLEEGWRIDSCYEAGASGYWLHRELVKLGVKNLVVAPKAMGGPEAKRQKTEAEWTAAFRRDPTGKNEKLIPVRIEDCQPPGLLGSIIYVDLVNLDEATARERLLAGLPKGRRKPSTGAQFPGAVDARLTTSAAKPEFPGALSRYWNVPMRNRLFTGREDVLEKLHGELERDRRAALSGLGGIGKTQTAIESHLIWSQDSGCFWARRFMFSGRYS